MVDDHIVGNLAKSFIDIYRKDLTTVENDLAELVNRQNKLEKELGQQYLYTTDTPIDTYQDMFNSVKIYKDKLITIKKDMINIHHKTRNLKKRAVHLQETQTKAIETKLQQVLHEEALIAKSSANKTTQSP